MAMWFFITFTQLLTIITSMILLWLIRPKRAASKIMLIIAVLLFNNVALIYGLSEFWYERFHVYLVTSIVQGFMLYAVAMTAVVWFILSKGRTI